LGDEKGIPQVPEVPTETKKERKKRKKKGAPEIMNMPSSLDAAKICSRIGKGFEKIGVPAGTWDLTEEESADVSEWINSIKTEATDNENVLKFLNALGKILMHGAILAIFLPKIYVTGKVVFGNLKVKGEGKNAGKPTNAGRTSTVGEESNTVEPGNSTGFFKPWTQKRAERANDDTPISDQHSERGEASANTANSNIIKGRGRGNGIQTAL